MIVSHKHRFIFLKTGKTAGTSVEIFLSRFLEPDDIATPIKPEDEPARAPNGPRNYLRSRGLLGWKALAGKIPGPLGRLARRPNHRTDFFNHVRAETAREWLGERIWRDYFKFAFDRNPWDKQVSYYYWATRDEPERADFKTFTMTDRRRVRGWPIYAIGDTVAVDFLGRYESLEADLASALQQVGLNAPVTLPRSKANIRPDRDYRRHYDDETRAFVARRSAPEIALLGYAF